MLNIKEYTDRRKMIANELKVKMDGKYFYYDTSQIGLDSKGFCIINDIIYDIHTDKFMVIIIDIDTRYVLLIDRCCIYLKEVYIE